MSAGHPASATTTVSDSFRGGPLRSWLLLGLIAATVLVYFPALQGKLLWDDDAHVTKPELQSLAGLGRIWFELGATQQYYPVLHSAFWLEHRLWGEATLGYHLTNLLLHVVSASLLLLILTRLKIPGAWLAAFIFAVHPGQVESIAWITEQKNALSTVFYLGAALAYLHFDQHRQTRFYWLAFALFLLALLTKSVTATLPAALLVVMWWQRGRLEWRRDVAPLLPWLALGAGTGLFTAWVERHFIGADGAEFEFSAVQRILLAGRVPVFYAATLLWPAGLIFIYPRWKIDPSTPWPFLYLVAVVGILWLCWSLRHRTRGPLAAALFFGGTLFPVLGFFNVYPFRYSFVADHFQYVAGIGVIVLGSAGLASATVRLTPGVRRSAAAALLLILGTTSARLAAHYQDNRRLFESILAQNPDCWMAHGNLGDELTKAGQSQAAADHFVTALRLNPDYFGASNNLGYLFLQQNRAAESVPYFENALRANPRFLEAHVNLAHALLLTGRLDGAQHQAALALAQSPGSAAAQVCVGDVRQASGQTANAIECYRRALALDPNFRDAHVNLGFTLLATGDIAGSIAQSQMALRLDPTFATANNNLGNALQAAGKLPEAAERYEAALRANPDYAEAHQNLSIVSRLEGKLAAAAAHADRARQLLPHSPEVQANFALVLRDSGRVDEARIQWAAARKLQPRMPPFPESDAPPVR